MKRYFIAFCLVLLSFTLNAQDNKSTKEEVKEKIDQEKTSFFTQKMSLTQVQSSKFWPLYNEYKESEKALRKREMALMKQAKEGVLSEKQYEDIVEAILDIEEKRQESQEEFFEDMASFLSAEQIFRYYQATKEFQSKLLHKLRLPAKRVSVKKEK